MLTGEAVSAQTVSKRCRQLHAPLKAFHLAPTGVMFQGWGRMRAAAAPAINPNTNSRRECFTETLLAVQPEYHAWDLAAGTKSQ